MCPACFANAAWIVSGLASAASAAAAGGWTARALRRPRHQRGMARAAGGSPATDSGQEPQRPSSSS